MASGADTHTHTYTHTYIRTEVISRNLARAPGLKLEAILLHSNPLIFYSILRGRIKGQSMLYFKERVLYLTINSAL